MNVDTLIITKGRPEWLERAILSVRRAIELTPDLTVSFIVGINGEDQQSVEVLRRLGVRYQCLERTTPAEARNRLFCHLKAEWVFFLDDDAFVPENFFSTFQSALEEFPDGTVLGGPNLTPTHSLPFQKAVGAVLACRFATFISVARYRAGPTSRRCDESALILCNLFIKRSTLEGFKFLERIRCAEENRLLAQIEKNGGKLFYVPLLSVWHERRENLGSLAKQVFKYGYGRGQNGRLQPASLRLAHLLPAICLAYSAIFSIVAVCQLPETPSVPWLLPFALYAALCVWFSLRHSLAGLVLFPLIHVAYGCGISMGLMERASELQLRS